MANEEVLGPRKTMFVLVIVVGCFAVLWPRILSPLILGHQREVLKPNKHDREAAIKQERPPIRGIPHPALLERGRAIPPAPRPAPLPPHIRVYNSSSPLAGYFYLDIKPPPIPGMRPPLGSPGGPVQAPKSSMGFVMPIYTICIIVFFVYTLSKILFKRTAVPYEHVSPDPQFRRQVFRDDSRSSPDKLVVTAISGLVAEVHQQMEANYASNQQNQETQDNHARPYTNGTVIHSGPVQIVASHYITPEVRSTEPSFPVQIPKETEKNEPKEWSPKQSPIEPERNEPKEWSPKPYEKEYSPIREPTPEPKRQRTPDYRELSPEPREVSPEAEDLVEGDEELDPTEALIQLTKKVEEKTDNIAKMTGDFLREEAEKLRLSSERSVEERFAELLEEAIQEEKAIKEESPEKELEEDGIESGSVKVIGMETRAHAADGGVWPASESPVTPPPQPPQTPAHSAQEVPSIYLETEIPSQSCVLVADFAADRADEPPTAKHSSLVVSGKMTLSLIQDDPRDTPERDTESTFDDFTTASAFTQQAMQKEDDLSDEDVGEVEEIEVEDGEEEDEVEEEEEIEDVEVEEAEIEDVGVEEAEIEDVEVEEVEVEDMEVEEEMEDEGEGGEETGEEGGEGGEETGEGGEETAEGGEETEEEGGEETGEEGGEETGEGGEETGEGEEEGGEDEPEAKEEAEKK